MTPIARRPGEAAHPALWEGLVHLWDRRGLPGGRVWWDVAGHAHAALDPGIVDRLDPVGPSLENTVLTTPPASGAVTLPTALAQPLTIAFSACRNDLTSGGHLFAQHGRTLPPTGVAVGVDEHTPTLRYFSGNQWVGPAHVAPVGSWFTACWTDDGTTVTLTLDGRTVGSVAAGTTVPIQTTAYLLRHIRSDGNDLGFNGRCAWLGIWSRALTGAEAVRLTGDPAYHPLAARPRRIALGDAAPATGGDVPLVAGGTTAAGRAPGPAVGARSAVGPNGSATGRTSPTPTVGVRVAAVPTGGGSAGPVVAPRAGRRTAGLPGAGAADGRSPGVAAGLALSVGGAGLSSGGRAVTLPGYVMVAIVPGAAQAGGTIGPARTGVRRSLAPAAAVTATPAGVGAAAGVRPALPAGRSFARSTSPRVATVRAATRRLPARVEFVSLTPRVRIRRWDHG